MFQAKLTEGILLKKLIESIKDLVTDINLEITATGISLRCDKQMTLGVSVQNLSKIMKCGGNDDTITLSAEDEPSALNIKFENLSKFIFILFIF